MLNKIFDLKKCYGNIVRNCDKIAEVQLFKECKIHFNLRVLLWAELGKESSAYLAILKIRSTHSV